MSKQFKEIKNMNTPELALIFATNAHKGQFRNCTKVIEYIDHPMKVVGLLKTVGITDPVVLSAAY